MNDRPILPPGNRHGGRRKTQSYLEVAEARTTLVKTLMDEERRATDAKTAKLRAQRLAKEEEDRLKAEANPVPASTGRAKVRRSD